MKLDFTLLANSDRNGFDLVNLGLSGAQFAGQRGRLPMTVSAERGHRAAHGNQRKDYGELAIPFELPVWPTGMSNAQR